MDELTEVLQAIATQLRVPPGHHHALAGANPAATHGVPGHTEGDHYLQASVAVLAGLQERLAAAERNAALLVLQGLDASGKDGTIKHVMTGVNPQGVEVHSFKQPTSTELAHHWLWRYQCLAPSRGRIGIFNRSHYEEVLVVRVHPELAGREGDGSRPSWAERYAAINAWEDQLVRSGVAVVKVLLHLSREEQARRFLERIEEPEKNWKFSDADVAEHGFYDDYQRAFADMLAATSTEAAPWHVVPADHKWYAHLATAAVLVDALAGLHPSYPEIDGAARARMAAERPKLEAELERSS